MNVTVDQAQGPGYITAYPCGTPRPTASNIYDFAGDTIAKLVIAKIGDGGKVCLFTSAATQLIADVNAYYS